MLALGGIQLETELTSKVLGTLLHWADKNQMAYDTCLYYIHGDVGCQASQGVFSVVKSDE